MPVDPRFPLFRMAAALAVTLAWLPLSGCGSTPGGDEGMAHRDTMAPGAAMEAEAGAAEAEASGDVSILRRTEDTNGSPNNYTMVLIDDSSELPAPVGNALRPDFSQESVIFLGMGRQEGEGFGTRITDVRRDGNELTVSAAFTRPEGEASGEPTTPWSAVVIPKQRGIEMPLLSDFQ